MRLADYSGTKRREVIALALQFALQDLTAPESTRLVARRIARRLETDEEALIGRTLIGWAPQIPEAAPGEPFKKYGREFHSWLWWPKGWTPEGRTRQARRDDRSGLAWRGKLYATQDELDTAKQAAGVWEV